MVKYTQRHGLGTRTGVHHHSRGSSLCSRIRRQLLRQILGGQIVLLLAVWSTVSIGCSERPAAPVSPIREAGLAATLTAHFEAGSSERSSPSHQTTKTVIWCFVGSRDQSHSVTVALQSGRISHVAIFSGNRVTSDTLHKPQTREVIRIAKDARINGVELILVRYLWQTQPSPQSELATLTDEEYYVDEINLLRKEAEQIGAKYVALDTETYGPTSITTFFRSKKFSRERSDEIKSAVAAAVDRVGKVDFVLPAGSARRNHPYLALSNLGRQRIAEGTYYDNTSRIDGIEYPYEIAGMYMNVEKRNDRHAHLRYFLPNEVFHSKKNIWQRKQGLMIWPREHRALEVATALLEISRE